MLEEVECPFSSRTHITPEINQFVLKKKIQITHLLKQDTKIEPKVDREAYSEGT